MNKKSLYTAAFLFLLLALPYFYGCGTIERTIYFGDVKVTAPINPPPVHVNINKEPGDVTISGKISSIMGHDNFTGSIGDHYSRPYSMPDHSEYWAKRENLEWSVMQNVVGADVDVMLGEKVSLFGGLNLSMGKNTNLTGGNLGIGFHSYQKNPSVRFDIGINIQRSDYFAITIVETKTTGYYGTDQYTEIYTDKGKSVNVNPFLAFTVNSSNSSDLINYFGSVGLFTQSLLGFEPGETHYQYFPFAVNSTTIDERADYTSYLLYLNPGISLSVSEQLRLLVSMKVLANLSLSSTKWFMMPSLQMDFHL